MSFQELDIKKEYRSLLDSVAKDFYIPLLSQAVKYQRAVGFFSSSCLVEISKGISELAKNGGKIQLVASPYLSDEDVEAIKSGYAMRDQVVKEAIRREMTEGKTSFEKARLNLLANLISDGVLDIKIAFTEDSDRMGMYHEKMGIITDAKGNRVAFAGSMNESATAMTLNYEAIDVFCSWKGEEDRVIAKENAFTSIWNDTEPNIKIIDFPELKQEIIEKYKRSVPDFEIDKKEYSSNIDTVLHTDLGTHTPVFVPETVSLDVLFKDMQTDHNHLAVVVNEYGETSGIVTMEDILEEIVGEIWDERDEEIDEFKKIGDNTYKVLCTASLEDFREYFKLEDEEELDVSTVNGWITEITGIIPEVNYSFDYKNLTVTITKADQFMTHEIKVVVHPNEALKNEE